MNDKMDDKQILIIDDNAELAYAYQDVLKDEGMQSRVAASGKQALDFFESGYSPHVVLVDCILPDMNGGELCDRIRKKYPELCRDTVFVGLSSLSEQSDRIKTLKANTDAYAQKPYTVDHFVKIVRQFLEVSA